MGKAKPRERSLVQTPWLLISQTPDSSLELLSARRIRGAINPFGEKTKLNISLSNLVVEKDGKLGFWSLLLSDTVGDAERMGCGKVRATNEDPLIFTEPLPVSYQSYPLILQAKEERGL